MDAATNSATRVCLGFVPGPGWGTGLWRKRSLLPVWAGEPLVLGGVLADPLTVAGGTLFVVVDMQHSVPGCGSWEG